MVERLEAARPATLGSCVERIRGITPAALAAILVQAQNGSAQHDRRGSQGLARSSRCLFHVKQWLGWRHSARLVIAENEQQNLVSSATIPHIWSRHILDSAQLLRLGPKGARRVA
jgi:hypothetical protein